MHPAASWSACPPAPLPGHLTPSVPVYAVRELLLLGLIGIVCYSQVAGLHLTG